MRSIISNHFFEIDSSDNFLSKIQLYLFLVYFYSITGYLTHLHLLYFYDLYHTTQRLDTVYIARKPEYLTTRGMPADKASITTKPKVSTFDIEIKTSKEL